MSIPSVIRVGCIAEQSEMIANLERLLRVSVLHGVVESFAIVPVALAAIADFDAKIIDVMVVAVNGVDVLPAEVRQLGARCDQFPSIAVLAVVEPAAEAVLIDTGIDDVLYADDFSVRLLQRTLMHAAERFALHSQIAEAASNRFQELITNTSQGMVVIGSGAEVAYVNPAATVLLGCTAAELSGKPFPYVVQGVGTQELRVQRSSDDERILLVDSQEISWHDQPAQLIQFRDVTSLKRVEQLALEVRERDRLDAMKDEFISNVSHEIRTPLTIIMGSVSNLRDGIAGALSEKQGRVVDIAMRNVTRLHKIITNLLDLSRLESGKAQIFLKRTSLTSSLQEIVQSFSILAEQSQRNIVVADMPQLPRCEVDVDMVGQVMTNLLHNALRFSDKDITVSARVGWLTVDSDYSVPAIVVVVADDGVGIPEDKQVSMFNKFEQVHRPDAAEGYQGTGLGLAICKEIMDRHQGKIWVESVPDQGAKFYTAYPCSMTSLELVRTVSGLSEAGGALGVLCWPGSSKIDGPITGFLTILREKALRVVDTCYEIAPGRLVFVLPGLDQTQATTRMKIVQHCVVDYANTFEVTSDRIMCETHDLGASSEQQSSVLRDVLQDLLVGEKIA